MKKYGVVGFERGGVTARKSQYNNNNNVRKQQQCWKHFFLCCSTLPWVCLVLSFLLMRPPAALNV